MLVIGHQQKASWLSQFCFSLPLWIPKWQRLCLMRQFPSTFILKIYTKISRRAHLIFFQQTINSTQLSCLIISFVSEASTYIVLYFVSHQSVILLSHFLSAFFAKRRLDNFLIFPVNGHVPSCITSFRFITKSWSWGLEKKIRHVVISSEFFLES